MHRLTPERQCWGCSWGFEDREGENSWLHLYPPHLRSHSPLYLDTCLPSLTHLMHILTLTLVPYQHTHLLHLPSIPPLPRLPPHLKSSLPQTKPLPDHLNSCKEKKNTRSLPRSLSTPELLLNNLVHLPTPYLFKTPDNCSSLHHPPTHLGVKISCSRRGSSLC